MIPTPEVPSIPGESLIIVPAEPPVLYASDPEAGQAFRSLDRGRSWSPVPGWTELLPRDPYGSRSPAVLVHPAVPARVFQLAGGLHRATFVGAAPLRAHGGRFETRAAWRLAGWPAGTGLPAAIDERAGTFWFLRPDELELAVKVVDGRAVNGRFWAFQTALTSLEYEVTVTDTVTGLDRTWFNPAGRFAARADTGTLVDPGAPAAAASTADLGSAAAAPAAAAGAVRTASAAIAAPPPLSAKPSSSECNPSPAALCLLDRFEVEAYWRAPGGDLRPADAAPLTAATGGFRFGPGGSLQLLVKLLDGRAVNGRFWVFYGGLTDRELEIVVTDRRYDLVRVYASREGELASAGDTSAFLGP